MPSNVADDSTVLRSDLLTNCNGVVETWIDGPDIYAGLSNLLAKARHEIDMSFYVLGTA